MQEGSNERTLLDSIDDGWSVPPPPLVSGLAPKGVSGEEHSDEDHIEAELDVGLEEIVDLTDCALLVKTPPRPPLRPPPRRVASLPMQARSVPPPLPSRRAALPQSGAERPIQSAVLDLTRPPVLPENPMPFMSQSPMPVLPENPVRVLPPAFPAKRGKLRWSFAATLATTALCSASLGLLLGSAGDRATIVSAANVPATEQVPQVAAPVRPTDSLLERARSGEAEAIGELESRPRERLTAREVLAVAAGKAELELAAARELRQRIARDPTLIDDSNVLQELRRFTANETTAREALAAMASLPGPIGPDLIYDVWTSVPDRTAATRLAETLVYSSDVLPKASPALRVALDLRSEEEDCQRNREIISRAIEHGDRRSLHLLARRFKTHGCGPTQRDDCFACLRTDDELTRAVQAVKARPGPSW